MSSFKIFDIAGSAMSAQSLRLNTVASNLANADAISGTAEGAYKARLPMFKAAMEAGGEGTPGVQVLERGWLSSNNVLFLGAQSTALVDSGYCAHAEQTVALVAAALCGRPLDCLVNSHLHSDHCGGNAALQGRWPALQTLIPPGLAQQVAQWEAFLNGASATERLMSRYLYEHLFLGHLVFEADAQRQSFRIVRPTTAPTAWYCATVPGAGAR